MKHPEATANNAAKLIPEVVNTTEGHRLRSNCSATNAPGLYYGCSASPFGRMWMVWEAGVDADIGAGMGSGVNDESDTCRIHQLVFETDDDNTLAQMLDRAGNLESGRRDDESAAKLADYLFQRECLSPPGLQVEGTPFQRDVWQALLAIPFGTVVTYRQIANAIGRPTSVRAVANAIGANPIAWLIPCHRVIRSDGSLGGYRWGLSRKQAMLSWEAERA